MTVGADDITRRAQQSISETWGSGTAYTRAYATGPGEVEALLAGDLALGSNMPTSWKDSSPGTAINSPKLQSVNRQHGKGVSGDVLVCTFIEVNVDTDQTVVNGYVRTQLVQPIVEGMYEDIAESWGIALTETSTGIPAPGDTLTGSNRRRYICMDPVATSEGVLHGRILVHAQWMELKDETVIEYWE